MPETLKVVVTHIENPSKFFFRIFNPEDYKIRREIERKVAEHASVALLESCSKTVDSVVGYLHFKWLKWCRAKIVSKRVDGSIDVFLIDYGYYLNIRDVSKCFVELTKALQEKSLLIHEGSLALKPCEQVQDRETSKIITVPVRYWNQKAVDLFKGYNPKAELTSKNLQDWQLIFHKRNDDGVYIGDLILKHSLETISISAILIKLKYAIIEEGMTLTQADTSYNTSTLNQVANFDKIVKIAYPELLQSEPKHVLKKKIAVVAEGVPLTNYVNKKVEAPPVKRFPNTKRDQRIQKPASINVLPSDMMVYGEQLRPKFMSFDNTTFSNEIKSFLKKNSSAITQIQAHAWPQIHYGSGMLIVCKNKSDLPMTFLPPILNLISSNRNNEVKGMGPIAVIVTKTATGVQEIASDCRRMAPEICLVAAFGVCDKRTQLVNGCDLLVCTPPAFGRLVEGISMKLIDRDRVKHLVFDGIDQMMKPFESEINEIVRKCTHQRKNEINPQIIITSSSSHKEIESKFVFLIPPKKFVVCIEDFFEATAFIGIKIVLEITSSFEEKFSKITKDLMNRSFKFKRTAIVTNSEDTLKLLLESFQKVDLKITAPNGENYEITKSSWLNEVKGNFSVLVLSGSVLERMNLTDVENLIHFEIPKNWKTFSARFGSLLKAFYSCLEKKTERHAISSTLFFDDERNVEEFVRLIKFMSLIKMEGVSDEITEVVTNLTNKQEEEKCKLNVPICEKIWKFGECKKLVCHQRHMFSKADESSLNDLVTSKVIKFNIISVRNPTSFSVKVHAHMNDESKWESWKDRNAKIENFIESDLQQYFKNENHRKSPKNIVEGETYVVFSKEKFKRCKVIDVENIAQVQLIDEGMEARCRVSQIFELPQEFRNSEPLLYHLNILNLVPFDREDNWNSDAKEKVERLLKPFADDCICVAQVQMTVQNVLLTETFDVKDVEMSLMKIRLKNKLMNMNICSFDGNIAKRFSKLLHGIVVPPKSPLKRVCDAKPTQSSPVNNERIVKEDWKHLSWKGEYEVQLKYYKSPDSFLAVLDSTGNLKLQENLEMVENCDPKVPLKTITTGAVCAAIIGEKTRRAKIYKINENDAVDVLLVDYGEIAQCQSSDLFELPTGFMCKFPFQSFHCKFMGIRPLFNMTFWPPKQRIAIEGLIRKCKSPLKMYVDKKNDQMDVDFGGLGMNSYEVILIDSQSDKLLNDLVVEKGFATRDDFEKPADLEDEPSGDNDANVDVLKKLLEKLVIDGSESEPEYEEEKQVTKTTSKTSSENVDKVEKFMPLTNILHYICKHPKIEWRQSDVNVDLWISATDCNDYGLKITETSIEVTIKYPEDRQEKALVDLYRPVVPKICSHELRGLNIIVRLAKRHINEEWPRLTESNEHSTNIKFRSDSFKVEEEFQSIAYKKIPESVTEFDEESKKDSFDLSDEENVENDFY